MMSAPVFLKAVAIVTTSSSEIPFSAQSFAEIRTEMGLCCGKTFRISVNTRRGKRKRFSMLPPKSSVLLLVKGDRKEANKNPCELVIQLDQNLLFQHFGWLIQIDLRFRSYLPKSLLSEFLLFH